MADSLCRRSFFGCKIDTLNVWIKINQNQFEEVFVIDFPIHMPLKVL